MRKLLLLIVLVLVAIPAWAGEKQSDRRGLKVSVGTNTNFVSTTVSPGSLDASYSADPYWPNAFDEINSVLDDYIHQRDARLYWGIYLEHRSTAMWHLRASDPSKFHLGDSMRFRAGRTSYGVETSGLPIFTEVRPRLGGSRWRLGIGLSLDFPHRKTTVRTRSFEERIVVDRVDVHPLDSQWVQADLYVSRWRKEQDFELSAGISDYLSIGPEFELVSSRQWDLSVEGGIMLMEQFGPDHRATTDRQYGIFLPEWNAPDLPAENALLPGEPDHDGGGFDHGSFQAYLGGRLEYFPLKHFGMGTNVRWYARRNPWSHHVPDLLGPVGIDAVSKRWSASVSLTYAR